MTMKMVTDLSQFFSENMQEPVPELAAEAEQSYDSLLKKLEKGFSEKEHIDLDNALLDLVGLYELKGFAWGLAAAREMVGLQMLSTGSNVALGCGQS